MVQPFFDDRRNAGRLLARSLVHRKRRQPQNWAPATGPPLVLGLPRGGVPVAREVAVALSAPLDVLVVRKLGLPGQEELALGAVASGGAQFVNRELVNRLNVPESQLEEVKERELEELERRERTFRGDRPPLQLAGQHVIVVDDGIATGATMRAAVEALRRARVRWITVAVPLAEREACEMLGSLADEVVCLETPEPFQSVGQWYRRFDQTTDDEVVEALAIG